jgi:hypothetical protein
MLCDQSDVPIMLQPTSVDVGTIPYELKNGKCGSIRGHRSDAGKFNKSRWKM